MDNENVDRKLRRKTLIKIANLGLDKENIKRRNAFIKNAREIYQDKSNEGVLYILEDNINDGYGIKQNNIEQK